ncbi:MAG: ABC transporter ATP-binding protein, partial [Gammaproteobacteria bacterium]|nr:ABC transporter ATP-binding protein [Gammaproteobacteria bacterium]
GKSVTALSIMGLLPRPAGRTVGGRRPGAGAGMGRSPCDHA